MQISGKISCLFVIAFTAIMGTAFGAQPPDVVSSDSNYNTAMGGVALFNLTTGVNNTASGYGALNLNTAGSWNTASGYAALTANTDGTVNTATGYAALFYNTTGSANTAFGSYALEGNTTSSFNTAVGSYALLANTTGASNTASGSSALTANTTGVNNTAFGYQALNHNTTGSNDIGIGYNAGSVPVAGSNNIEIGHKGLAADTGVIRIGTQGVQHFTQIAGVWNTVVKSGQAVVVNSKGQIGVASTKLVSVANAATQEDVASLRTELAAAKNMIYALQREVTTLKSKVH